MGAGGIEGYELIIGQMNKQAGILAIGDREGFSTIQGYVRCMSQDMTACSGRRGLVSLDR